MTRPVVLLGLIAVASMTGCSGAPPRATLTPTVSSPSLSTAAPDVNVFPDMDTKIDSAPPSLAARWRPYGVTIIPSSSVVAAAEPAVETISVANHSGGVFSDAQVHQFAVDDMRDQLLAGWAAEHVQPALSARLVGELFLIGADGTALADGTSLHYQACSLVPTSFTVLAPNPALDARLVHSNQNVTAGAFPIRLDFSGCAVTGTTTSGRTVTVDPALGPSTVVVDYVVRHDPLLGELLFGEGAIVCPDATDTDVCDG